MAAFLAADDLSKPEWQALNQKILTFQALQSTCNTQAHNPYHEQRLRARYDRADCLLRATNLVLGFDPDTPTMPNPQSYLRDSLNRALTAFGLEVTKKKPAKTTGSTRSYEG